MTHGTRVLALVAAVALVGCNDPALSGGFERAGRETTPVLQTDFQQSAGAGSAPARAIRPGYVLDEIYAVLCDIDDTVNCTAGADNIYNALRGLDGSSEDTFDGSAAGSLVIPFFGDSKDYQEKNPGRNVAWSALKGGTERLLYFRETDAGGSEVFDSERNKSTGAVDVRLAGYWPGNGGTLALRVEFSGNELTHDFSLRIAKADPTDEQDPFLTFRGAGVSKGEGNYFLFHADSVNSWDGDTQNGYHCLEASTTADVAGNDTAAPHENCAAHVSALDEIVPFVRADLPSAAFDSPFTGT